MTALTEISSPQNPRVKLWRSLKAGGGGMFLAEGEHMAGEALKQRRAQVLLCDAALRDKFAAYIANAPECCLLPSHILAQLAEAKAPQGIIAVCKTPENAALSALGARVVALDGVQDPGNVGAILRTMDAAGFTGLLADERSASAFSPKALRASMGGCFRVPVRRTNDFLGELAAISHDHALIAADVHGERDAGNHPPLESVCLIIGSEGAGVSKEALALCSRRIALPMPGGAESLNAAVAAGIFMYDIIRGRL